ncbi:MAG: LytTR family transcriptional regulator DNA-binding domain-containing protein [Alicyclobacillus sp.]|nr:LytTR family transcriptional regulator DNA-binding domain-containing protein [Alicyclobacillus sp.]
MAYERPVDDRQPIRQENLGDAQIALPEVVPTALLRQLPEVLRDWLPPTASIAVADLERYTVYSPGAYDIRIHPGEAVRPGSIAERVLRQHQRVESDVEASVFGIPYHGLGYPLQLDSGLASVLTIILPPKQSPAMPPLTFVTGEKEHLWRPTQISDVVYFESYQKKTYYHTATEAFAMGTPLQDLERRLPPERFLRVHRSFIVNVAWIDHLYRDRRSNLVVVVRDERRTEIPVAQTYVRNVRRALGF